MERVNGAFPNRALIDIAIGSHIFLEHVNAHVYIKNDTCMSLNPVSYG